MEIDKTGKADNLIKYAMYDCQNELITTQSTLTSLLLLWGRYMVQILNLIVPNVGAPALHKSVLRSSLRNTPSSDAIERMVQAQVKAQLETKPDVVVEQDSQIEAKVSMHVSNYEKAQMEWFKKLELLPGRELPPSPSHQA
ncbi:hypothetical protein Tco_1100191 [Tanacetum coccineum]